MPEENAAFAGSIPESYERYLGPALFTPYAVDLARRAATMEANAVLLEVACGTGIVTEKLREQLPSSARLIATDLNEGMISFGIEKRGQRGIEWQQADAMALPFADESCDAVVCQFGLMFVPDKALAMREARRVLKPGGKFLFNVWDQIEKNDFCQAAHRTILEFFAEDPPRFFETPFGFYDQAETRRLLESAGFKDVTLIPVELESVSPGARDAATGLVQGTPVLIALLKRDPAVIPRLIEAVTETLIRACGEEPCRGRMRALVWEATR